VSGLTVEQTILGIWIVAFAADTSTTVLVQSKKA
jgi:hypothetical protein